ncbi:hypothetical protein OIV83_001493 [Microbotryomycetes sp. JL201]|nr:hypothetical protein OIV83_001493 [Microbotryomycetes sp. JL201]
MLQQLTRTPSEVQLSTLTLDLKLARLSDEDLIATLPSIGQGEIESQEHDFARVANRALLHLATPPIYSPCSVSPVPDTNENMNPFFARKLYHDCDTKWARPTPPSSSHFAPSSSASSSGGDYFSPPLSHSAGYSSGVRTPPLDPNDQPKSADESSLVVPVLSLAQRRGCTMRLDMPAAPDFELEMRKRMAQKTKEEVAAAQSPVSGFLFTTASQGVLKSNFAGVTLTKPSMRAELSSPASSAETPLDIRTLPLRRKRRDHGFAF